MKNFNKDILDDLNLRTSFLEALEWDDEELEKLVKLLEEKFLSNYPPEVLLDVVEKEFNSQVSLILKDTFMQIYIQKGELLFPKGGDNEH